MDPDAPLRGTGYMGGEMRSPSWRRTHTKDVGVEQQHVTPPASPRRASRGSRCRPVPCHRSRLVAEGVLPMACREARGANVFEVELDAPSANGLVGHGDAALSTQVLDTAETEGKSILEPRGAAHDFGWEAMSSMQLPCYLSSAVPRISAFKRGWMRMHPAVASPLRGLPVGVRMWKFPAPGRGTWAAVDGGRAAGLAEPEPSSCPVILETNKRPRHQGKCIQPE